MKVAELFEEVKGSWKISNLKGKEKTFRDEQSPEARAWMKNRDTEPVMWNKKQQAWQIDPKFRDSQDKKDEREWQRLHKEPKAPKINYQKVYDIVIDAIGSSFPDGDPIDHIIPKLKRMGLDPYDSGKIIDQALKKFGHGAEKKGLYKYMETTWSDFQADQGYDAEHGHIDKNSPFYDVDKSGKIVPSDNPWKGN